MSADELPDDDLNKLESDVGELLSQAEQLTDQLAAEVGSEQAHDPASAATPDSDPEAVAPAVEAQLAAADAALDDATRELGSEPAPAAPKPKGISLPPKQKPAPGAASGEQNQTGRQPAPGSNSGKTAVLPGKRGGSVGAEGGDRLVAAQVENPPFELQQPATTAQRLRGMIPTQRVGRACSDSATAAAKALEWIDRPFHFVGYRVRTLIGWAALALMTATVALYLFVVR